MITSPPLIADIDRLSDRIWLEVESEESTPLGGISRIADVVLAATNWPIRVGDMIEEGDDGRLWWYPMADDRPRGLDVVAPVELMRFDG